MNQILRGEQQTRLAVRTRRTRKELKQWLSTNVAYFHGRRVFDAVVFELYDRDGIVNIDSQPRRTIVVLTGGCLDQDRDRERLRRLSRRLKTLGFEWFSQAFRHPMDGIGGSVRFRHPAW